MKGTVPSLMVGLIAALCGYSRIVLADDCARAPEESRLVAPEFGDRSRCHLLVTPTFVPSLLVSTYAGIRVGGGIQLAQYRPFETVPNTELRATGMGAIDVSKVLIDHYVALLGTASGVLTTGVNGGSVVGDGANVGGGLELGLVAGTSIGNAQRIGLVVRVGQRYGTSLLLTRVLSAINQDVVDETLENAGKVIAGAAGSIVVPFVENDIRVDGGWTYVPLTWFSLQTSFGVEESHRYYRTPAASAGGELGGPSIDELTFLQAGVAAEFDVGKKGFCHTDCWPLAFVAEYRVSPRRTEVGSLAQSLQGTHSAVFHRSEQVVAVSVHYASELHRDLDAAATFFYDDHPEVDLADPSASLGVPAHAFGGELMARYFW